MNDIERILNGDFEKQEQQAKERAEKSKRLNDEIKALEHKLNKDYWDKSNAEYEFNERVPIVLILSFVLGAFAWLVSKSFIIAIVVFFGVWIVNAIPLLMQGGMSDSERDNLRKQIENKKKELGKL